MSQTQRVTGRATSVFTDEQGSLCVIYHQTIVAKRAPNSKITLNTGGWRTVTTKTRMNQFANQHCGRAFGVFQRDHDWFVSVQGRELPFTTDTITFTA